MAKSRIGPFALEAPMSTSRAAGQMFRGIHLEQRKLAALRVYKIPMGLTPESRQAFATQLEQLKRLRHPGIVRCYGGGFDARNAYLAYELIDGESLDQLLERRERLPWETALQLSQQLAEALNYAHQAGWVHGRLKRDKVLLNADGQAKVADWRRNSISNMFDTGKPTQEQLLFAAPEILQGETATAKSDLYSLGGLMFTMLSGRPPFQADLPELIEVVSTRPAPDVSATVMDCPVWLSAIVGQLLNKDPQQRPYSAAALLLAFKEAERRQSEGVGVLQHATAGFSPLKLKADRDEAEKVLGIKPKKKRKKNADTPLLEQAWFLGLAFLCAVAAVVWFLLPLGESQLKQRAERLLPPQSQEWLDWNDARDRYLRQLTERFPEGEHSPWAEQQIAWVNAREKERRLERDQRLNRTSDWTDADRQFWEARNYEQFGDAVSARQRYEAIVGLYADDQPAAPVVYLANESLQRIDDQGLGNTPLVDFVQQKLVEAEEAFEAAKVAEAREIWEWIVTLYAESPQLAAQVDQAQLRLAALRPPVP